MVEYHLCAQPAGCGMQSGLQTVPLIENLAEAHLCAPVWLDVFQLYDSDVPPSFLQCEVFRSLYDAKRYACCVVLKAGGLRLVHCMLDILTKQAQREASVHSCEQITRLAANLHKHSQAYSGPLPVG